MKGSKREGRSFPLSLIVEYLSELNKEIIYNMMFTTLLVAILILSSMKAENTVLFEILDVKVTTLHVLAVLLAVNLAVLLITRERVERLEEVLRRLE